MAVTDAAPERSIVETNRRHADDYEHFSPVLAEYARLDEGDPQRYVLRQRLIEGFLPVVEHIAVRHRNRGEPLDDLEQVGAIDLIGA